MPAFCAVPDEVATTSRDPSPKVFTLSPPAGTGEVCDTSVKQTTTTGGSVPSVSNTVGAPGPAGPQGPAGPTGAQGPQGEKGDPGNGSSGAVPHDGMRWAGAWENGVEYLAKNIDTPRHADTVKIDGGYFICIADHTSSAETRPQLASYKGITNWSAYWELIIESGVSAEDKTSIDKVVKGAFDWMKNATVGDWIKAITIGAGIIIAGTVIKDLFLDDGTGTGTEDSRYNGTLSYTGIYSPPTLPEVVESLCIEAGIESYDVSQLSPNIACQFALTQILSARNILDNLSKAFQFDMVDSSGTLKFVPRKTTIVRTFTHEDMGFNSSNDFVAPVAMKRLQSIDLARSVSLTYIAEDLDFNNFSQKSEIPTFEAGNDISLTVPFVMTHELAKRSTEEILIGSHFERMQYTFKVSYQKAIDLEPSDVVSIPEGLVRIVQIEEVDEGILEIHAVDAGAAAEPQPIVIDGVIIGYTASSFIGTGESPQLPAPVENTAGVVSKAGLIFIDPPVNGSNDTQARIFACIHGYGVAGWPGAQLFRSTDGGSTYSIIGSTSTSAKWGLVGTAINTSQTAYWDDTTVITVQMKTGKLISKSDSAVLSGENFCMVGGECIAFGIATLVGTDTYQLSHLLRGRRGTEYAVGSHVANELFVLLDDSLIEIDSADSDRGKTYLYKVVTYGSDLTKVAGQEAQIFGSNTIPWTAGRIAGVKTSTDFNLTWLERPRFNNELVDYIDGKHDDDWGGYAVVIYNGDVVVRQEIVYETIYSYTNAMQITDFGSVQINLKFAIYQISNKYGGGRPTIVNI